jgi:SAM-dependent methyltransferase
VELATERITALWLGFLEGVGVGLDMARTQIQRLYSEQARPKCQSRRRDMPAIPHYTTHATAYAASTRDVDMTPLYARFLPHVPAGGRILDAGCGSGRDALAFRQRGHVVDAFDASPELAALASAHAGIPVRMMGFLQLGDDTGAASFDGQFDGLFDGIWACASLLHVAASDQPQAWARLWRALKPGGVVYASYKLGDDAQAAERVDALGRPFTDATEARVASWLQGLGDVARVDTWITGDQRPDQNQAWLNVMVTRRPHLP